MSSTVQQPTMVKSRHSWLRPLQIAWIPGLMSGLLEEAANGLLRQARLHGHEVQDTPDERTDVSTPRTRSSRLARGFIRNRIPLLVALFEFL